MSQVKKLLESSWDLYIVLAFSASIAETTSNPRATLIKIRDSIAVEITTDVSDPRVEAVVSQPYSNFKEYSLTNATYFLTFR